MLKVGLPGQGSSAQGATSEIERPLLSCFPFFLSHQSSGRLELCSNRVVLMLSNSHTKPAAVLPRTSPVAFTRSRSMAQLHFAAATTHSLLPATHCAATAPPKHPPAASHSSDKVKTASYYHCLKQLSTNQPKPHM